MQRAAHVSLLVVALVVGGCPRDREEPLSLAEAIEAVEEASLDSQASQLTAGAVEISTHFTIGQAVESAAAELRAWIESQLPCAELTLTGATLEVRYGVRAGNCTYQGLTYSGSTSITLRKIGDGQVVVEHRWTDLSDQRVKVSGEATVTWDFDGRSRRVQHELTWTRIADGRTGVGSGDRTQTPLPGGVGEGIQVDGERSWRGKSGTWDLAIESVQMRWADPLPQAGRYVLRTPRDRSLALGFSRVGPETLRVTVEGARRSFRFDVTRAGAIEER